MPGWSVTAGPLANLHSLPSPAGTLALTADRLPYGGSIVLHEAPLNPDKMIGKKLPPQREQPELAPLGKVYLTLEEQSAFLGPDTVWEHRADYFLLARTGQVVLFPPARATFTAAFLDSQELPLGTAAGLPVRLEGTLRRRRLTVCWRWPPGQEPAGQPDLSKPRLENVAKLPGTPADEGFWEIVAPAGLSVKTGKLTARPVDPPLRLVRRAAGALCEAQFLASVEGEAFRESETQFHRNAEAATAWLAQASGASSTTGRWARTGNPFAATRNRQSPALANGSSAGGAQVSAVAGQTGWNQSIDGVHGES